MHKKENQPGVDGQEEWHGEPQDADQTGPRDPRKRQGRDHDQQEHPEREHPGRHKKVNKCQCRGKVNIMQIDNHNIKSIMVSKEVAGRCFRKC